MKIALALSAVLVVINQWDQNYNSGLVTRAGLLWRASCSVVWNVIMDEPKEFSRGTQMTDYMQNDNDPFDRMELEAAIRLRWVLRDIRAGRLTMLPASPEDLATLTSLGLIEINDNIPRIARGGQFID
jgi:hypothetical protein